LICHAVSDAMREIARVLRVDPSKAEHSAASHSGCFCPVWNTRDLTVEWQRALEDLYVSLYTPDVPRQQTGAWRALFPPVNPNSEFVMQAQREWEGEVMQTGDRHMVWGRIQSLSVVASASTEVQTELKRKVFELLDTHTQTKDNNGVYEIEYTTDAFVYRKA
jgi:hypothetical protein